MLRDVGAVSSAVELLGSSLDSPVGVAPVAMQALAHPDGELATARAAREAGSLLVLSTRSTVPLEQVAAVAGPWWFQVYAMRERRLSLALATRAADAGATALVLTGDTPYVAVKARVGRGDLPGARHLAHVGPHLADGDDGRVSAEQDPTARLDLVAELAQVSGLPVLVKGVLRADDAAACLDAGAAGVVVSNHGGRQLDRAVATRWALPEVAAAVAGRGVVLVDGGLRSGLDVLCALALGARGVLVGRPVVWALATGGEQGVTSALRLLSVQLRQAMALAGAASLAEVTADLVAGP